MTTTSRPPEQPRQPQTPTDSRPDGDRSAPAVARIGGHRLTHVFVDEVLLQRPGNYRLCSRMVSGVWEHTVEPVDPAAELMAAGRRLAKSLIGLGDAAREAGLHAEQPPTEPRARALWQRQHRSTGPQNTRHARRSSW